jgi:hypothetical protein
MLKGREHVEVATVSDANFRTAGCCSSEYQARSSPNGEIFSTSSNPREKATGLKDTRLPAAGINQRSEDGPIVSCGVATPKL